MYIPTKNIYGFSYMFWFLSCGLKEEEKMSKTPYHARYHAHPYIPYFVQLPEFLLGR